MLNKVEQQRLFDELFDFESLSETFTEHFMDNKSRGYDGLTAEQALQNGEYIFNSIPEKIASKRFRFTPSNSKTMFNNSNCIKQANSKLSSLSLFYYLHTHYQASLIIEAKKVYRMKFSL